MAEQEVVTESLSGSPDGFPLSLSTTGAITAVHQVPAHAIAGREYIDAVSLKLFNIDTVRRTVDIVLNPIGGSGGAETNGTVKVVVPPEGYAWVLQGERFRRDVTGATYTIGVEPPVADKIKVVGWVARFEQDVSA
jgi:hypothetical protein